MEKFGDVNRTHVFSLRSSSSTNSKSTALFELVLDKDSCIESPIVGHQTSVVIDFQLVVFLFSPILAAFFRRSFVTNKLKKVDAARPLGVRCMVPRHHYSAL